MSFQTADEYRKQVAAELAAKAQAKAPAEAKAKPVEGPAVDDAPEGPGVES